MPNSTWSVLSIFLEPALRYDEYPFLFLTLWRPQSSLIYLVKWYNSRLRQIKIFLYRQYKHCLAWLRRFKGSESTYSRLKIELFCKEESWCQLFRWAVWAYVKTLPKCFCGSEGLVHKMSNSSLRVSLDWSTLMCNVEITVWSGLELHRMGSPQKATYVSKLKP